jgi:RNA polymerase sigma factor (sigma-70 family)
MPSGQLTGVLRRLRRAALLSESAAQPDGDLLNRYLTQNDDAAFESLLQRHGAMVLGVCRRILRNEADAHDAFQATFLVFVRKARTIEPRGMVGNWLYGVAQRTSLRARALARQREANTRLLTPALRDPLRDQSRMELCDLLDQELSRIPERYRAPVVLCGLEERSLQEAARQLDCPVGTVASRLARGRDMLARRLARQGLALSGTALALSLAREAAAGGVPSALFSSTAQAASALVVGHSLVAGMVSSKVIALTEGAVRTMFLAKMQWVTVVCLSITVAGAGGTFATYRATGAQQERPRQQAVATAANEEAGQAREDERKSETRKSSERKHGYLGVVLAGNEEGGPVVVHKVFPDSPAARAGVETGDIVLKVGKTEVKDRDTAVNALAESKPGEKVTIRFKRGEKEKDLTIKLEKWPANFDEGGKPDKPRAPEKARGYLGLKLRHENGEVVVGETVEDSPADKAGIKAEDILLKVGKDKIESAEKFIEKMSKLKEGDKVTLRIKRGEKEMDVTVTAGKRPADFGKE